MAGSLAIGGSADAPSILGDLTLRRGTFDLFSQRLEFQRGTLTFDGGSRIDPALDLAAETTAGDVEVTVTVGGTVSQPTVTLASSPELPQDEIAARLLFGTDVGSLSAFQAVGLAQSLGQLTGLGGGGVGVLDEIRRSVGLDRLEVTGGEGEDAGTTVSGGRYVSEGVYVGIEQGLGDQSSSVQVEIELTPNIAVESEVGTGSQSSVGVRIEWDY
ncbi:MAG: hypothetical protein HKM95_06005 [Inquilinus sp.]|nr:hypothetical protein [Inquilinus sp.]